MEEALKKKRKTARTKSSSEKEEDYTLSTTVGHQDLIPEIIFEDPDVDLEKKIPNNKKFYRNIFVIFKNRWRYIFLFLLISYISWKFFAGSSISTEELAGIELEKLVKEVGVLIELPPGEDPTVATVTDPNLLNGQEFFKNSTTGDKVLIYPKARKAFLYSPTKKKLIEVAPLGDQNRPDKI